MHYVVTMQDFSVDRLPNQGTTSTTSCLDQERRQTSISARPLGRPTLEDKQCMINLSSFMIIKLIDFDIILLYEQFEVNLIIFASA